MKSELEIKVDKHQGKLPYNLWLNIYCIFSLVWVVTLLYAGGFTTSIKAGMAFLDWPLSNGSLNPEGWLTESDQMAEHSHRLLGMQIGLLSIVLVGFTYLKDKRNWVRRLAWGIFLVVFSQGLLGGARVMFDQLNLQTEGNALAQTFAVLHACLAQVVLCMWVTMALVTSRLWFSARVEPRQETVKRFRKLGHAAAGLVFLQLIIGAVMRHIDAGLAIPTFPLASQGSIFPAQWSLPVIIHFAHRVGAFCVLISLLLLVAHTFSVRAYHRRFRLLVSVALFIVGLQIFFGAQVIWTYKNPYVATVHVVLGAVLLSVLWAFTFLTYRFRVESVDYSSSFGVLKGANV